MTLDEAIKHCEEKAKELRTEAEQLRDIGEVISSPKQPYNEPVKNCLECAREHEQLAEWLKELKTLRDVHSKVYRNEHCDRAGKCIDYIGYHCAGCSNAKESNK